MASFRRVWHLSTRLEVAALLMLLLLVLAALLSLFPQFPQVAPADPERLARWEASVSARYGGLARLLDKLGLFHPSRSPVLWLPLGLLVLTTVLCTLGRWRAVWGEALPGQRMDCAPSDAPYASRLPLPSSDMLQGERLAHLMQELGHILAQRGFQVRMVTGALLCGERNRLAALATLVTHLAVLLLVGGLLLSYGYGWREEVTAGPEETVAIKHVRGLALCQEGFAISRYPDGSAAGYEVRLSVVENGGTVAAGVVRLNEPLSFHSLHIYLTGYAGSEEGYRVTLLVVHDPGYGPVLIAGFLLLIGLTVSLNFPPVRVQVQGDAEGILLTGRCERRAWEFEREFSAIVGEAQQYVNSWGRG